MRVTWLPDVLRRAGLTVHEVSGWRSRGADSYGPVRGITIHGTGGSKARTDVGEIDTLLNGSSSAPPPIAQLYLGRQGHWWVVASGLCYHNKIGWGGPNQTYGNDSLLGIEAAHNNRDDPWPDVQYRSYVRGVAALVAHKAPGWDMTVARVAGHKEHQPGDKPDPTFNMTKFRADVRAAIEGDDEMTPEQAKKLDDIHYQLTHIAGTDVQHRYAMRDLLAQLDELLKPYTYVDGVKRNLPLATAEAASVGMHGQTIGKGSVFLARRLAELEAKLEAVLAALPPAEPVEG